MLSSLQWVTGARISRRTGTAGEQIHTPALRAALMSPCMRQKPEYDLFYLQLASPPLFQQTA